MRNEEKRVWVFGGIESESKKYFLVLVLHTNKETMMGEPVQTFYPSRHPECFLWLEAYSDLEKEEYLEDFMNNDDSTIHSQNVERPWESIKGIVEREDRKQDETHPFESMCFY